MKNKLIILSVVACTAIAGCGGSGGASNSNVQGKQLVLGDGYDEIPGDVVTTSSTLNVEYSNGQTADIVYTDVNTYTQVSEIPNEYGYSSPNDGPFLLKTSRIDGELNELKYMTLSGEFIIEDDLNYFSNVEYTTQNGSEDPENIYIDNEFTFSQNSTLFNSKTGVEAGYDVSNIDFVVIKEERITVPAGSFNSVKISYNLSATTSKDGIVDTLSGSGFWWFDTTNGLLLRSIIEDGYMTLNEYDLTASFSAETVLQNYFISQTNSVEISQAYAKNNVTSFVEVNPIIVIRNLKKYFQIAQ